MVARAATERDRPAARERRRHCSPDHDDRWAPNTDTPAHRDGYPQLETGGLKIHRCQIINGLILFPKRPYKDMRAVNRAKRRHKKKGMAMDHYWCVVCHVYHLTSTD
jgi:hypothetical protein